MANAANASTDAKKSLADKRVTRRVKKAAGRSKEAKKLATDVEFAKAFFSAKSKRSTDKKAGYKKKKKGKK